jgi:hypothetical protein
VSEPVDPGALPAEGAVLAGFLLAHALWCVSDSGPDDALCPMAIVVTGAERKLLRFEAASQVEAVQRAKSERAAWCAETDVWAFAREGTWRSLDGSPDHGDAITIDFWARPMSAIVSLVQGFRKTSGGSPFRLTAPRLLSIDGALVAEAATREIFAAVLDGVHSHGAVAPLWPAWSPGEGAA